MSVLYRLQSSLRSLGLRATASKLCGLLVDHWLDVRYGLDICPTSELAALTISSGNKHVCNPYAPTRLLVVRRLFRAVENLFPQDRVLVDIGCGKGRVLLAASEFGFREARGVEFARELCQAA